MKKCGRCGVVVTGISDIQQIFEYGFHSLVPGICREEGENVFLYSFFLLLLM